MPKVTTFPTYGDRAVRDPDAKKAKRDIEAMRRMKKVRIDGSKRASEGR